MSTVYRIHEFSELTGVTVKALRHYDRLGLLKPKRTDAGYREYADADLERLEQIIALKFLGFSLKHVKDILERTRLDLLDALRLQRHAIEEKQAHLSRALRAIHAAEESIKDGNAADPGILKRLIEVIDVHSDIESMKKYYNEAAWERRRRYYEEGPAPEWQAPYRDVRALLAEDPGGEQAQEVADRWLALSVRSYLGDPDVQTDSMTAWADREHWPATLKQRVAEFKTEDVTELIKQAALSSRKKYFSEHAWARYVALRKDDPVEASRAWQARVDLFRDIEATLGDDPASDKAQALAARWRAQLEGSSGSDPAVKAGLMKAWTDRRQWQATLRWQTEALHMMSFERFDRAADFIDAAVAADTPGAKPELHRD